MLLPQTTYIHTRYLFGELRLALLRSTLLPYHAHIHTPTGLANSVAAVGGSPSLCIDRGCWLLLFYIRLQQYYCYCYGTCYNRSVGSTDYVVDTCLGAPVKTQRRREPPSSVRTPPQLRSVTSEPTLRPGRPFSETVFCRAEGSAWKGWLKRQDAVLWIRDLRIASSCLVGATKISTQLTETPSAVRRAGAVESEYAFRRGSCYRIERPCIHYRWYPLIM